MCVTYTSQIMTDNKPWDGSNYSLLVSLGVDPGFGKGGGEGVVGR